MTKELPDFSLAQICWLLDITKPRIGQLEEADIVVKTGRDRYAAASIRNFVRFQRKEGGVGSKQMQDVKLEVLRLKANMGKLDLDEREGKLLPLNRTLDAFRAVAVVIKQKALAFPSKFASRLLMKRHAAEVEAILRAGVYEWLEGVSDENAMLEEVIKVIEGKDNTP